MLTHLSLFSGIGGLDLAAEQAGFTTVGQCEWAEYPTKVLEKHWPDVPRWKDIRTLTGGDFYGRTGLHTVDVISGGFPCQPFSVAGKRRGKEDDRYLWPEMLRIVQELRPSWVVGENVAGIVNMELDTVLADLEGAGYSCQTLIIPACGVDAPHQRNRCAILAYTNSPRHEKCDAPRFAADERFLAGSSSADVADAKRFRLWPNSDSSLSDEERNNPAYRKDGKSELCEAGRCRSAVSDAKGKLRKSSEQCAEPARLTGSTECMRWKPEPDVGRVAYGVPHRVDRLRALGNAVVPAQFYPIFRYIAQIIMTGGSNR